MGFPGKFESTNLSRDNLSREIGRTPDSLVKSLPDKNPRGSIRDGNPCGLVRSVAPTAMTAMNP